VVSLDAEAQIEHLVVDLTKEPSDQMGPEKVRDELNKPGSLGIAGGSVRRGGTWVPSMDNLSQGQSTLEVRWIRAGALTRPVVEWFGPFSGQIESREDVYLLTPEIPGAVYKIRGAAQLDLKIWQRSSGVLDVPGRACGALGSWKKWSFPLPSSDALHAESQGWVAVRKVRRIRRFALPLDASLEHGGSAGDAASCAVELTAVTVGNEHWWTLCLEAQGNHLDAPMAIDAAARSVFREPLPDGSELESADAMPYLQWLHRRVASRDVRVSSRQKHDEGSDRGPRFRSPRDAMSQTERATAASTLSPAAQLERLPELRMLES
jgi:hypothetical protein